MPKHITCPLSSEECQRLQRNLIFLKEHLEQDEIRDIFVDEGLWDICDLEKIDSENTSNEKNEMFLRLLLKSGPTAYKVFTAALQKTGSSYIVERLENTSVTENFPESPDINGLSDANAQRLTNNWIFLKENIEQNELRDHLIVEAIWDFSNIDKIDSAKTSEEKNEKFLNLLLKSCPRAYEVFIAALKKKKSTHILERLENTPISNDFSNPFENVLDRDILENWQQEDVLFVPTKSSRNVENMIESQNLVIVAGHSGSGKSAMTQHIALKYRRKGWVVKPVDKVEEIKKVYASGKFQPNKTIFVLHDPIGKESYNEILYTSWKQYEQTLEVFLQKVKLLLTSRTWIISDKRAKRLDFVSKENVFIIDDEENKLNDEEKRQIFKKYISIAEDQKEN
ncbi:uncharacterized protein LOC111100306 [Crassostrea virginica]